MKKNLGDVSSLAHLLLLRAAANETERVTYRNPPADKADLPVLGASMAAMYQAATCHRGCRGTGHLLERIVGRAYNVAAAAHHLILQGFYDEALSLIRSLGEIFNIAGLALYSPDSLNEWVKADRRQRLKKFSPAKVRLILERAGASVHLPSEWYSDLCESFVHITPHTAPGKHGEFSRIGPQYQETGFNRAIGELATTAALIGLFAARYFEFFDLFEEISAITQTSANRGVGLENGAP